MFWLFFSADTTELQTDDNCILKRVEVGLKRKEKEKEKEKNNRKKRCRKRSEVETKPTKANSGSTSELSDSDKKLLDRWKNMQSTTTPFIHPIRKYMPDIMALKQEEKEAEATTKASEKISEATTSGASMQHYQFTRYLSDNSDGESLKAVKDPAQADLGKGPEAMFGPNFLGIQTCLPLAQSSVRPIHQNTSTADDISVENMLEPNSSQDQVFLPSANPTLQQTSEHTDTRAQETDVRLGVAEEQMDPVTFGLNSSQTEQETPVRSLSDNMNNTARERIILSNIQNTGQTIQRNQSILASLGKVVPFQNNVPVNTTEATITGNHQSHVFPRNTNDPNLPFQVSDSAVSYPTSVEVSSVMDSQAVIGSEIQEQNQVTLGNSNTVTSSCDLVANHTIEQRRFSLIDFISNNSNERTTNQIFPTDSNSSSKRINLSSDYCETSFRGKTAVDGQAALLENVMGLSGYNAESLTLPLTPKGSCGSGYGLGLDVDEFLNSEDGQKMFRSLRDPSVTSLGASPPLSASLLNAWLPENIIDPVDVTEIQNELESASLLALFEGIAP